MLDEMRMSTACFARAPQRYTSHLSKHFLFIFQEVTPLSKTRNQLIVNSLGWRELRPFQDAVIPAILAGKHLIILAPTAGGKTEAAFFLVLSRMLSAGWRGLSVLYICPIKALLNNLDSRLQRTVGWSDDDLHCGTEISPPRPAGGSSAIPLIVG